MTGSEEWYKRSEEITEQFFDEIKECADEYGRDVSTVSEIGDPQRIIVDHADETEIDHIVIGAHGRSDEERPLFGSVAELVARRAAVPVTLIR